MMTITSFFQKSQCPFKKCLRYKLIVLLLDCNISFHNSVKFSQHHWHSSPTRSVFYNGLEPNTKDLSVVIFNVRLYVDWQWRIIHFHFLVDSEGLFLSFFERTCHTVPLADVFLPYHWEAMPKGDCVNTQFSWFHLFQRGEHDCYTDRRAFMENARLLRTRIDIQAFDRDIIVFSAVFEGHFFPKSDLHRATEVFDEGIIKVIDMMLSHQNSSTSSQDTAKEDKSLLQSHGVPTSSQESEIRLFDLSGFRIYVVLTLIFDLSMKENIRSFHRDNLIFGIVTSASHPPNWPSTKVVFMFHRSETRLKYLLTLFS